MFYWVCWFHYIFLFHVICTEKTSAVIAGWLLDLLWLHKKEAKILSRKGADLLCILKPVCQEGSAGGAAVLTSCSLNEPKNTLETSRWNSKDPSARSRTAFTGSLKQLRYVTESLLILVCHFIHSSSSMLILHSLKIHSSKDRQWFRFDIQMKSAFSYQEKGAPSSNCTREDKTCFFLRI